MLPQASRKRARPSRFSFALTVVLTAIAGYLGVQYFGLSASLYALPAALATLLVVVYIRVRSIRVGLPAPFGGGEVREIDSRKAFAQGVVILAIGIAFVFAPYALLFYFPGGVVIGAVLGVVAGLTSSEIVFFLWLSSVERRSGSEVYSVTELMDEQGRQYLLKSVVLEPTEAGE